MDIDAIFAEIGDFGRQQKIYAAIINVAHLYLAINVFHYAIAGRDVDFQCVTNETLPANVCPDNNQCHSFSYYSHPGLNSSKTTTFNDESMGMGITSAKDSIHASIISEWNLVCDRSWLKPLTMSVFMFSLLAGTMFFGNFSDRIGRKPVLIFVTISLIACDTVCSFVQR